MPNRPTLSVRTHRGRCSHTRVLDDQGERQLGKHRYTGESTLVEDIINKLIRKSLEHSLFDLPPCRRTSPEVFLAHGDYASGFEAANDDNRRQW